jgi:thiol:disulfide interchange protein
MTGSTRSTLLADDRDIEAAQWYVRRKSEDRISAHERRVWEEWTSKPANAVKYAEFTRLHQRVASLPRPSLPSAEEIRRDAVVAQTSLGPLQMIPGRGRFNHRTWQNRVIAACCGGLFLLVTLSAWLLDHRAMQSAAIATTSVNAEGSPFSESALERMRASGRPVFVNLRASWCPTCTANERTVLARNPVQQMMTRKHVAYLTGDWTLQDPTISAELRKFGRNGVPLYLLFSPGAKEPMIFPQVLTEHIVLRELSRLPDSRASSS